MYGISPLGYSYRGKIDPSEAMYQQLMHDMATPNFGIKGFNSNLNQDLFGNVQQPKKEGSGLGKLLGIGAAILAIGSFIVSKGKIKPAFSKEFGKELLKNLNPLKWNLGDKIKLLSDNAKKIPKIIENHLTKPATNPNQLELNFPGKVKGNKFTYFMEKGKNILADIKKAFTRSTANPNQLELNFPGEVQKVGKEVFKKPSVATKKILVS